MSDGKQPTNIMQLTQLVIAVGALGVGGSSWLKPPDTTAVETGHKLHSAELAQMEANQARMQRDLRNMHAFMIGYVAEQHEMEEAEAEAEEEARPRRRGRAAPAPRRARRAPKLPSLSAAPKATKHRGIEEALGMSDAELEAEIAEMEAASDQMEAPPEFAYEAMEEGPPELPF